ncbi:hypothetical protein C5167_035580 [Papaver somniferum]|uniref:Uncharacterized protein n=1 Tax=Papaver somniferum TaxID=3469 RepID=A0A4Y7KJ21_PAPSO|nr:hypothetical protein C5167_035580 [Papaver somniferum]
MRNSMNGIELEVGVLKLYVEKVQGNNGSGGICDGDGVVLYSVNGLLFVQEVAGENGQSTHLAERNHDGNNAGDVRRLVENMEKSITEETQIYGELEEGNEYGIVSHHLHQPPPLFFLNQFAYPLAYHQILTTTIPVHIPHQFTSVPEIDERSHHHQLAANCANTRNDLVAKPRQMMPHVRVGPHQRTPHVSGCHML